jgi:hypothetical protein
MIVPGFLSELQGYADFPGDVWCQDPDGDCDVKDNVDLPEVPEALQDLVDGVQSYVDGYSHFLCSRYDPMNSFSFKSVRLNTT